MLRRNAMLALAGTALPIAAAALRPAAAAVPDYPTFEVLQLGTASKLTSQTLLQRSKNVLTRTFASLEIIEQTAAAQALTANYNPPPPKLTPAQQAIVTQIQTVPLARLDYAYVAAQITGHQALLAIQEAALVTFAAYPTYDIVHEALLLKSNIQQHLILLAQILPQVPG